MRMVTIVVLLSLIMKRHEKIYIGKEEAKVFENNVNVYLEGNPRTQQTNYEETKEGNSTVTWLDIRWKFENEYFS